MLSALPALFALDSSQMWIIGAIVAVAAVFILVFLLLMFMYGGIWFQAYMSNANVRLWSLVGMSFRRVNLRVIVQGKIMAMQAGIGSERETA